LIKKALAGLLFLVQAAFCGEIKVMTSGAFTAAYLELVPKFEGATKNKVVTAATSMGVGADSIPSRLEHGEPVDVVIVADAALEQLIKDGRIVAGSRVALARSSIGMAVRAGAPKPDISSVEALKRTLLNAKSIAYSASVSGDYLINDLFPRLGIADKVASKSHRIERERVGAVVARGEAEIGFQQVSELLPVPGIDYVGPLPQAVQKVTIFSAGIPVNAKEPEAARALIQFLGSAAVAATVTNTGLEPVAAAPVKINVIVSGGFSAAYRELVPEMEQAAGVSLNTGSGQSQGNGPNTIGAQLRRGVAADVVILSKEGLGELVADGRIAAGSSVDLAQTLVGVSVRAGAVKPDIATVDAFKQTLLHAASITFTNSTVGLYLTNKLFPQLGIYDQIKVKITNAGVTAVGKGEAEMAIQPMSELVHVAGTDFVGTIPREIQYVSVFSAAMVAGSKEPEAAKRLIAFLASEKAAAAIKNSGMERPR